MTTIYLNMYRFLNLPKSGIFAAKGDLNFKMYNFDFLKAIFSNIKENCG
jgi:hypothetical protein